MIRFILAALFATLLACSDRAQKVEAIGPSLYPITASLVNQRGEHVGLDVDRGHPVIIAMFYGSCPSVCPLILSDVKRIDAELSPRARENVRVLLVSFDGSHDTPAELARIARERGLDGARFTLASGSDDDVRTIAAALGVTYRAMPEGGFSHDSVITTLDREGRPTARVDHFGADLAPLVSAIERESPK
jgi:protein SCO1/2